MSLLQWFHTATAGQIISSCGLYRVRKAKIGDRWICYHAERHLVNETWLTLKYCETVKEAKQRCQDESEVVE